MRVYTQFVVEYPDAWNIVFSYKISFVIFHYKEEEQIFVENNADVTVYSLVSHSQYVVITIDSKKWSS